jgi:hypothetical protein
MAFGDLLSSEVMAGGEGIGDLKIPRFAFGLEKFESNDDV